MPLTNYTPCMYLGNQYEEGELLTSYFNQGYTNPEILEYLKLHGINISLSTLKRRLASVHLRRRPQHGEENRREIRATIEEELAGSGCYWLSKNVVEAETKRTYSKARNSKKIISGA